MSTTTTTAKEDTDESRQSASKYLNEPTSKLLPRVERFHWNRAAALCDLRSQNQLDSKERSQ